MTKKTKEKSDSPLEDKEETPNPRIRLVYVGPTITSEKKVGAMFYPVTDEQWQAKKLPDVLVDTDYRVYGGVKDVGRPGVVFEFEYPADKPSSIYPGTRRYLGFLDNDPRAVEWQANRDAFLVDEALKKAEKSGKNKNLIQTQLAPVKVAYNKMVGHQRAAFLAQVIGYITGRVTKEDERIALGRNHDEEDW